MDTTISIDPIAPVCTTSPRNSKVWKSCCLTTSPQAIKYFVQVSVLISLIAYSMTMIVYDNRCESQRAYGSLLMMSIGVFIPAPKIN